MNKIERMIETLCPEGVEFVKLGEVCEKVDNIKWKDNTEQTFKYIDLSSVDRQSGRIVETTDIDGANHPSRAQQIVLTDDILFGSTRPTLMRLCIIPQDYNEQICSTGFCVLRAKDDCASPRFMYHTLRTERFHSFVDKNQEGASYPSISDKRIKEFEIPLPPLSVQLEIVRVLDKFTELEAELEAELDCRKRQYAYYRDRLIADAAEAGRAKWVKLGEVCEIRGRIGFRGYTRNDLVKAAEGAITLSPSNIVGGQMDFGSCSYISWAKYEESPEIKVDVGDVLFTKTGSTVGKTALIRELPKEATINPQLVVLKNIKCNPSYLTHVLQDAKFQNEVKKVTGQGSVPNVSQGSLAKILIPLPPLAEQERIAGILDRFETLTADLTAGLPAEIAARRQQYEHYRDRLLTFRRKET